MMRAKTIVLVPALVLIVVLALAGSMIEPAYDVPNSGGVLAGAARSVTPPPSTTLTTATSELDGEPTDARTATAADDLAPPPEPSSPTSDDRTVPPPTSIDPYRPVHDVMPGTGSAPSSKPVDPIGDLDDQGPVPAGLGFTAPPTQAGAPNDHGGATGLAVEPSCSHQCISRGVAYPRGFGAELIVETTVPAKLFISVVADLDDNGTYEDSHYEWTPAGVTAHSWALDHLQPGQIYHVMAAATDDDDHTAYVWGEFTTLSTRDVFVVFGEGEVVGGPDNIVETRWHFGLDGPLANVTPGQQGILLYQDLPRRVDIDFWVQRSWEADLCEGWTVPAAPTQGHDTGSCDTWNSVHVAGVDLDTIPAGSSHWTETAVALSLQPPSGAGDALPPGYGDPYYFSFEVPMTLHVTYS